jgi:hypothetical protein
MRGLLCVALVGFAATLATPSAAQRWVVCGERGIGVLRYCQGLGYRSRDCVIRQNRVIRICNYRMRRYLRAA